MSSRTYTARVTSRGRTEAATLEAPSSESAAIRTCHDRRVEGRARVDVAMHVGGRAIDVATYAWDGRDVTLVGRPS